VQHNRLLFLKINYPRSLRGERDNLAAGRPLLCPSDPHVHLPSSSFSSRRHFSLSLYSLEERGYSHQRLEEEEAPASIPGACVLLVSRRKARKKKLLLHMRYILVLYFPLYRYVPIQAKI
jgi:hypothetical protein